MIGRFHQPNYKMYKPFLHTWPQQLNDSKKVQGTCKFWNPTGGENFDMLKNGISKNPWNEENRVLLTFLVNISKKNTHEDSKNSWSSPMCLNISLSSWSWKIQACSHYQFLKNILHRTYTYQCILFKSI